MTQLTGTKKFWQSKTLWGAMLIVIVFLLEVSGLTNVANIVSDEMAAIQDWLAAAIELVGFALVFLGRIYAKLQIDLGKKQIE